MPLQINDGGVLRLIHTLQINDGGVLRNCYALQINDNGVLRTVYLGGEINDSLPNGTSSDVTASFIIDNDGTYLISTGFAGNWVNPAGTNIAALYEVRVDVTSGAFTGGSDVTGAWLSCATQRSWFRTNPGSVGQNEVTFNISFRLAGGATQSTQTGLTLTAITSI